MLSFSFSYDKCLPAIKDAMMVWHSQCNKDGQFLYVKLNSLEVSIPQSGVPDHLR